MPIIVIGGIKGGSGKTTIATNLVVIRSLIEGRKVLFVDADEQKSAFDWVEHRESSGIQTPWTTICLSGSALRSQVYKMAPDYDDIIIDSGGRDTTSQRSALTIADIFLAPFQPRSLDIWTIISVSSLINDIKIVNPSLRSFSILNRGDAQGKDNEDASEILKENETVKYLPTSVIQRKSFSNAAALGLGVTEMKPQDKKASSEIQNLCDFLFKQ